MKKIHVIAALLAMLMPTMLFAGDTYYAALKAQVSSNSSGMGKVYAGTSNSTPSASSYNATSSQSSNQSDGTQNTKKTFYAFAQANEGFEFVGWSTSDNGSNASTANPYSVQVACSSKTESSPTLTTVYANFKKKMLAAFSITFETSSAGTYTVDGAAPANKTGLTEATSVVLKSTDANFLNWLVNGTVVNNNPYTATYMADTTISAEFLTADQVVSVTTISEVTAALSNAAYKKIIIPSGTSLTVAKGTTVTVPAGKQLVVDGALNVIGTVSNSGVISGSGKLYKISYLIDQGEDELQILYAPDGSEYGKISNTTYHSGESSRYYKTKVTSNTPSVNGTVNVSTTSWGALLNGNNVYAISAQTLKGVQVSLDNTVAANKISGIVGSLTTTDISSGETSGKKNWLLFADCNLKGPVRSDATTRLNFNGTIDLGGHKLTFGQPRTYSDFYGMFLNGTIDFQPSTDFQNGGAIFFNCAPITVKNIKGTPTMLFYDCGTAASPATLTFSYQSGAHRNARFYNGYYSYSFNTSYDNGYAKVYGGSFTTTPSSYLADVDTLEVKYDGKKYYVVQEKKEVVNVVQIGSTPYETLEAAVDAAVAGDTISLIERVELTGTTTIPAGKNITIALDGHTMTGGKIVNNGTLIFTDATTGKGTAANEASGGKVESDIENDGNGTLDFVFGTYSGAIVNKSGTLTTHNGLFTGTISMQGGTVNLKGGHFSTDVETLATVENTKVFFENNLYSVCELPNGTMYSETLSGNSGYGVTPYSDDDFALVKDWFGNKNARTSYTATQWKRLAELLCFYQLFNNNGLDATLAFDRDVTAKSLKLYAKSSLTLPVELKFNLAAGQYYRALSETLIGNGYYAKTYKALWDDNIKSVATAVSDETGNNAGTVCAAMIEIWTDVRDADYGHNGLKHTNTVFIAARKLFTLGAGSNKAMIRPATGAATFYATLGAAMGAAADGGTVMLANDCDTALPLNKAGTYTFDTMGFAASDAVSVSDGLFVKSETAVDSSAKVLVPDAKATTYVVAQKVASVGGTFYDNLTEAVGAANGATVTLLAATDETITLGEGQTFSLNKNGIAFDDTKVVTSVEGSSVKATMSEGVTVYSLVKDVVTSGEAHYPSIEAAIEAAEGNTVAVTVVAADTETIDLDAGKTLVVTVADGVEANVTVDPGEGAFIDTTTDGNTTTYESKKITVEMEEPPAQATVEVVKVDHGVTNAVSDTSLVNEAVHALTGNHDVSRTDNTDKLDVLDKITVTPMKIVEDVTSGTMIIRSVTFNVVPHLNAGQSLTTGQTLKFRLPVDAAATQLAAIVYHGDAQFGIYPVQTYNNEKFVEVESDTFSPYGYELLDGETANPIAAIGTTGYASLAAAAAAVPTDGTETTITMLADETIVADAGITIAAGKNIVLDLNGQTVQMAAASADERWLIKNEGTLTVKDSAENGKLLMSATGQASTAVHKSTIKNMGALTVESGTIELTYSGTNKEEPTAIMNDASDRATSLTVKGGTVVNSANRGTGVYLAVNDTNATVLDVQGGRVEGYGAAVRYYFDDRNLTDAKLTFNMSNGTIHGRGMYGVQGMTTSSKDWNGISFNISGGTVSCAGLLSRKSVISPLQGTVSISGGTFAGDVYIYGHALEITDGDFAGSVTLHRTKESLESASISGGQFSSGLTIAETTADNTTNPYYNAKFITGGIYGTAPEARNVVDEYAVVDNTDSDTQGDYPKTIGGAVASVTAEGNTTYYATLSDAITAANASDVTEITILDSSITTSPDADWKVVGNKLVKKSYVAQIGTTKYESLVEAVANASEGDTVLLLTDVTEALSYGENASVTLNLNGNTISVSSGSAISVTAGELTVTSVVDDDGYATGGIVGAISVSDGASLNLRGGIYDVDWDECDIEGSIAVSSVNRFYDSDPTEVEAASAVFTSPVPYEYCSTGFIPGAYDDIYIDGEFYYYVKEGTYLWKITDADGKVAYSEEVPYADDDEEWWEYDWFGEHEMNRNGFTMTLLHDVSADDDNFSAYVSGLTYTVDLGGHTVNQQMGFGVGECDVTIVNGTVSNAGGTAISIANGAQVTLGDGLVIAQSTTGVYVEGGTEEGAYSKLTVKNGAAINGTYGVLVFGSGSANPVTEVVVEGGTITGTTYGISGNGTIEGDTDYSNTRIAILGGTVSGGEVGIYHPQAGELSVSGGTISGKMAIYARSGTIAVTGGSLNATGTSGEYNVSYAGDELQQTGDALVLDAVDYPGGNPTATISGGTFVSVNGDGVASYAATGQSAESGFVSGGTFSSEVPEEYCADGFIPTGADPDTGLYTVKAGSYVAQIVRAGEVIAKYETLADAIDAAQNDDTVELLANIANFTGTQTIDKSLTLDGAGHSITAAAVPADGHRNMVDAFMGGTSMLKVESEVTLRNITLDGDATHRYTYLVSADNSSAKLTTSNVRLLNGGELAGDANGAIVEQGAGYGAGIHLNNGAQLVVSNGFYACTGGPDGGVFPFTGILPEGGASVSFELTENPNDPANVDIGNDLLLVGMVGVIPLDQVQDVLDYMKVPSRFIPYTLTLGDGSAYAFTGASPRTWNDIIDYGKEIMDVSTAIGYQGLDKSSTPVEVGLLTDTVLPDTFRFADTNFTVNGNGNALAGTIEYTDNAGQIHDIVMGTEGNALVLDMTDTTKPIVIGSGISVSNVTIQMTAEQATAGTPVIIWDAAHGVDAPENEAGVSVVLVNDQGQPTSDTAELIWDDEMGMAYIGPVEARLTGPTHETPIYTTLANAIAWAEQTGDTVTLMTNIVNFTGTQTITKQDLVIDGAGHSITAAPVPADGHRDIVNAWAGSTSMFKIETGAVTFRNITLNGDATHAYTFLISADNSSITLTTENVRLLNGGELCGDSNGEVVEAGAGYGAAVHLNNGAHMVVSNGFYACTGGKTAGCFPFTGILVDTNGGDVKFELTGNPNDPENVDIGGDLLLVGMPGVIPLDQTQGMLDYMKVPTRFIPYTLTLGDGSAYAFTGASPLGWNDIINYGKEIMDVSTAIGYQGLDKISTPVEVGLLTDTVLPDTFRFADTNFTVNGNGNALAGTIEYTDNAGQIHDIVMGTEGNALVLDMTDTTKPIVIGSGITVSNVTVQMTAEQATAGTPVIIWDAAHGVDAPENEAGVTVQIVDDHGDSTGVTKDLIWDDEMGMAYIGPCEARLTGPTHDKPIYTTLADAIAHAEQSGDTVTLLMNVTNVTTTYEISKQDLVIDGAGYTVAAAPVTEHRNMFEAWSGSKNMFKLQTGNITFRNITLDGDETHAYTFLISADNSSVALTTENVRLIHGGEISEDSNNATVTPGNGYGAAIHLNNGAHLIVSNGFYACTGTNVNGVTTGVFPFTAILPENLEAGTSVAFELTGNPNDPANVDIGDDLLLVGMIGDLIEQKGIDAFQGILNYMKVPSRFIPYTLTLADGSAYAFTGASPRRWNEIIDYGKDIMDVATANGFSGLDKDMTPVEVGLATDTVLPAGADGDGYDFLYEDSNFSINGNGNALSGTIKFTDDANGGLMHDIDLGTDDAPLTLDLSATTNAVMLGGDVIISNVVVKLTEDQATLGKVVFEWDSGETPPDDEQGVEVTVVNNSGTPTGETKGLVWDEEYGVAYIGPVEARLTGTTHETPVYTSLANALDIAKDNDKVELLTNAVLSAVQGVGSDVTLDLAGYKVSVNGEKGLFVTNATLVIADTSVKTNGTICAGDEASPASLIESGNGGVVNIPTGIFAAASGQNVLVTSDNGAFAVSGGYFSNPVLPEHCAPGYAPIEAPAGAPQQYTVGETVPEFRYPIDGTAGVPVTNTWLATYMSDIYDDPTKPIFANITNDLVQALSVDGANGIPRWESYVLGLDPTDPKAQLRLTATSKDAATVTITGLIDTTKFPEIENVAVTFRLAEQNGDKWTDVDGCTGSDVPSFTRPLEGVADKVLRIFADIEVR